MDRRHAWDIEDGAIGSATAQIARAVGWENNVVVFTRDAGGDGCVGREAGAHLRGPNAVRRIDEEHLAIALEPRRGRHRARRNPQPRVRATSFVRSNSPAVMTVTSPHFLDLNSVANLLIPIECELQTC